jgi:hypothetical protein
VLLPLTHWAGFLVSIALLFLVEGRARRLSAEFEFCNFSNGMMFSEDCLVLLQIYFEAVVDKYVLIK